MLQPTDCVLEIGTGSLPGRLASQLAHQVTTIEIDSRIAAFGEENLRRNQIDNVTVEVGDAHAGWGTAEFDAILVTGSVPVVPDGLKYQLAIGGRLVVVVGQAPVMTAMRITAPVPPASKPSACSTPSSNRCAASLYRQFKF